MLTAGPDPPAIPRVAIACQGGGSHAAFAAGVLRRLFSPACRDRFDLVALSGTSGGAMCAALAWAGLHSGGPSEAIARLGAFWGDLAVSDPIGTALNDWGVLLARSPITAEISPYAYRPVAEPMLRALLQRHLRLKELPAAARSGLPGLLVGATDILAGNRVVFPGATLTEDDLIASAALPPLFRAVAADGTLYWDGLFSTNPPVREFTDLAPPPDEIWVIQIDPQRRADEPRSRLAIDDRRNELAGNLSLGQELYFIERINALRRDFPPLAERYRDITIRVVELGMPGLDYASKFDRSPALLDRLTDDGETRAEWFFDDRSLWPRVGSIPQRPARPLRSKPM